MPPLKVPRLLIVDGHAYAYRAFYAIRHLTSPGGAPTNAIYGFISMLAKLKAVLEPSHLLVVWDGGLAAERMAALPAYKEHRPPMPADLEKQLEGIDLYLEAARSAAFRGVGMEADDGIATVARQAVEADLKVLIASSDKDFMQLVSDGVGLVNPGDKCEKIWTAEDVLAKTGVEPRQVVDWLSLIGDAVDNIPGVPGVGPKTATELLRQFGSVQDLYVRVEEVKAPKLRASLLAAAAAVRRNQELIRLNDRLPGAFCLERMAVQAGDGERLSALYRQWGFRRMLEALEKSRAEQRDLW